MLAPDDRALLLDALRPPAGMPLQRAVGTTFTLDLETALTVPLAFAGQGLSGPPDPVAVMEAVRSTAGLLDLFCQAGAVSAGRWPSDLVALLEPVIHEARRPRPGHLFHPKVWVLHYGDGDTAEAYRVLVLSRNLTADRSWDVIVRLDGAPARTVNHDNQGLVRFVAALPRMTKAPLPPDRLEAVAALADHLRRVHWELPAGASRVRFWPFGLPGSRPPRLEELFTGYRHLIVSPFVNAAGLGTVIRPAGRSSEVTIVSRAEELDRLPPGTLDGHRVHVIDPAAGLQHDAEADAGLADATPVLPFGAVHAKMFVVERNHRARLFAGSANATQAGFGGNVELLCELEGGPSKLGVEALVGEVGFGSLLGLHVPAVEPAADDGAEKARELEAYLMDAAQVVFTMRARPAADGWAATVTTQAPLPPAPPGTTLDLAAYNRPVDRHHLTPGEPVQVGFGPREAVELTPFLLLSASRATGGTTIERAAVIQAQLVGGPEDRLDEILVRQIDTPEKFLRLLLLLLGLGGRPLTAALTAPASQADGGWSQGAPAGVFELLVRALAVNPAAIDRLADIVDRLAQREQGRQVLPPGWDELWSTVAAARQLLQQGAG
jgi:hypothetical protein